MQERGSGGLAETAPAADFEMPATAGHGHGRPPSRAAGGTDLEAAMEDARILVGYASRSGTEVEEAVIAELAEARAAREAGEWSAEREARFWIALNGLARAIRPVTVASIRASVEYGGPGHEATRRVVQRYRRATLGVLLLLLVAQIYWLIGNNIAGQIDTLQKEVGVQTDTLAGLEGRLRTVESDLEEASGRLIALMSAGSPEEVLAPVRERVTALARQQQDLEVEVARAKRLLASARDMLASSQILLQGWDIFTGEEDPLRVLSGLRNGPPADAPGEAGASADPRLRYADNLALLASRSALSTFNQYVLPLLYGLVGALAFILRTLSREMAAVTYAPADNLRYTLRWPLGMLAGITVGWFFDPETLTGLAAVQPLALAFLAGYSVELLFAGLDRIVAAFTGEEGRNRTPT